MNFTITTDAEEEFPNNEPMFHQGNLVKINEDLAVLSFMTNVTSLKPSLKDKTVSAVNNFDAHDALEKAKSSAKSVRKYLATFSVPQAKKDLKSLKEKVNTKVENSLEVPHVYAVTLQKGKMIDLTHLLYKLLITHKSDLIDKSPDSILTDMYYSDSFDDVKLGEKGFRQKHIDNYISDTIALINELSDDYNVSLFEDSVTLDNN